MRADRLVSRLVDRLLQRPNGRDTAALALAAPDEP
jgi:hypothetical protein